MKKHTSTEPPAHQGHAWEIYQDSWAIAVKDEEGTLVCQLCNADGEYYIEDIDTVLANAKLISCAPQMLTELETARNLLKHAIKQFSDIGHTANADFLTREMRGIESVIHRTIFQE